MWSSPHALCMEHHGPETLTEPKISEKPPVGRQLHSGPRIERRGSLLSSQGEVRACLLLQAELAAAKPLEPQGATGGSVSPSKASDCPRPGPSQLWLGQLQQWALCPRGAAKEKVGCAPYLTLTVSELFPWAWVWFLEESGRTEEQQEPSEPVPAPS